MPFHVLTSYLYSRGNAYGWRRLYALSSRPKAGVISAQSFTIKEFVDGEGDADSERDNVEDDDGKGDREDQEKGECASDLETALFLGQLSGLD